MQTAACDEQGQQTTSLGGMGRVPQDDGQERTGEAEEDHRNDRTHEAR